MAKIVRSTQHGREEIELGSFQLTIGRRPDNNIVIDNAYTAPQHAVVGFTDGQHYIRDLKTQHGTRVNGLAVKEEAPLRHGDSILIGLQRLDFLDPPQQRSAPPPRPAAVTPPPVTRSSAAVQPPMMRPAPPPAAAVAPPPRAVMPPPQNTPRTLLPPADAARLMPPSADATAPLMPEEPFRQPSAANAAAQASAARDLPLLAALPDAFADTSQIQEKPPASLLDHLVGSIRSHRDREQQEREDAQQRIRGEWLQVVASAEQLKQRLEGDPRVHYFAISRRNNDFIIRSQRAADLPVQFLQMSMEHPEEKGHALTGLWLRRTGQPDRCYPTAKEALSELVRDLAYLLA